MEASNIQLSASQENAKISRIDLFYQQRLSESAIANADSLKAMLQQVENFDWEEFNKPVNQINMQKVVNSIRDLSIGGKWKQKVSKNAKPSKAAIQQFVLDKSFSLGIGCGKYGDLFHIKRLKSRFCSHSYKFGDEAQKALLQTPISELEDIRRNMTFDARDASKEQDPKLAKKLTQGSVEFDLFSEDTLIQETSALEQVKYLILLQHIIAQQVANEMLGSPSGKDKVVVKVQGSVQSKYDESKGNDVTKMKLGVDCLPLYSDSQRLAVVSVSDCETQVNSDNYIECDDVGAKAKNIQELLSLIQLKNLDILVAIDSCCTKKVGRELIVMPKFKIIQAVIRDAQQRSKKHVGLKLFR